MVRILNIFRKLFKRRQHERYHVQEGVIVIVSPKEETVQAIDISMGGMAFIYEGNPKDIIMSGTLTMTAPELRPQKVGFDTVSDIPAPGGGTPSDLSVRRRGVKFKWLGVLDKEGLKKFINEVSTFNV